ncbi:MAG: M16 family metallopeptidase [Parvibaculaceae bacterium]
MTVRITRLDNGIHVLTHDFPQLETVALGVWVRAGARDERESENGLAHFLEHMAFKGTSRRDAFQIAAEIEAAGGEINAATAMETTAYYARVLKEDWPLALDILADILTDPIFDVDELEREKDVILQEIAASNDTPDDLVFDLAQAASWPGHPLGRPILGTADHVEAHGAEDMVGYRGAHYGGARMVVSAAGRIDHEAFVAEAARLLAGVPSGGQPVRATPAFAGGPSLTSRPLDQTHLVLSFPSVGYHDDDIYAVQVLSSVLGGGMSSRLFQEVREKRGLCYSVFSTASAYQDTGLFTVYAASSAEKSDELAGVVSEVMLSLIDGVGADEIARARAQLKAGLVMSLESASGRADQIARQFLAFGRVPLISEIIAKVERVDEADIRRLASRIFRGSPPAVAAVGDISRLAPYDRLAARFA